METVGNSQKLKFSRRDVLGEGSNGTCVYKGWFEGSLPVAIKRMIYFVSTDWNEVLKEVNTLKKLDHPNVIRYRLFDHDRDFAYIALELCDASLMNELKSPRMRVRSQEVTKLKISLLKDILQGLEYLHLKGVIHRDLKPQNVLVKRGGTSEVGVTAIITDFGLSLEIADNQTHITASEAGSKGWIAREMLDNTPKNRAKQGKGKKKFKKSSDIFSFGCIAQVVLSNPSRSTNSRFAHPFGAEVSRERNIFMENRVAYLTHAHASVDCTALLADLMIGLCVSSDADARPTAGDLLNFPLFWSFARRMHFLEKIFNDFKDKFGKDPIVNELEANWKKYSADPFTNRIPEAWGYHVFCRKEAKQSKPSANSLFNALLRNMRNIRQHCIEATGRYKQKHKHPDTQEETTLEGVLGDKSDEDIGRYFLTRIPVVLPVTYLTFFEHARQHGILKEYYKNTGDLRVEAAWSTMDRVVGEGRARSRSKSRSG